MQTKKTKLPPGPENNEPVVGSLYSVYYPADFVHYTKWPHQTYAEIENNLDFKDFDQRLDLIKSVPYAMLTRVILDEDAGSIIGSLLVKDKIIDFWLICKEEQSCLDLWQYYFIPGIGSYA